VDIVHEKDTIAEASEKLFHPLFIELLPRACRSAFQSFQHASLVSFGLQQPNKPGAGICQTFVIQIDRILGSQDDSEAIGPRLFEEGQQWGF
jgi:hypothetical protein